MSEQNVEVSCPRCTSSLELEAMQLVQGPVTRTCPSCGLVFRVGAALNQQHPADPVYETEAGWYARKADGAVLYFPNLAVLVKWASDGMVALTDEISKKGHEWRPIREMPEFTALTLRADSQPAIAPVVGAAAAAQAPLLMTDDGELLDLEDEPRRRSGAWLWIVLAAFICGSLLTWLITSLTRPSSHLYLHSVSVPERAQTQTAAGPASTSPRLAVGPASSPGAAGSSAAGAAGQTGAAAPAAAQSDAATSPDSATTSAAAARAAGATPPGGGGASAAGAATQPSGSAGSTGGAAGSAAGAGAEGAGAASPAGAAAGGTSPETAGSDKGAAKEKAEEEEPSKKSRPKKKKRDRASSSRRSSPTMSYDRLMDLGAEQLRSDPRKAVATFMKALQTPSATSEARAKLGRAYLRLGDHGAAISQLERARRANPHYRPAMWDLAEAYRRVGDKDKARAIYKEMLRNVGPSSKSAARARKALDSL